MSRTAGPGATSLTLQEMGKPRRGRVTRTARRELRKDAHFSDTRLVAAMREDLVVRRQRVTTHVEAYWEGRQRWQPTWWTLLHECNPKLVNTIKCARDQSFLRDYARGKIAEHFDGLSAALDQTVAGVAHEITALPTYTGPDAEAERRYLRHCQHSPFLRFARWREAMALRHPHLVTGAEAAFVYPGLDALLTEQLGPGLDGPERPLALLAFALGIHAPLFPKVLEWLETKDEKARVMWRVLAVAPLWAAAYVATYQVGTHGVTDLEWTAARDQWVTALQGTAILFPVEAWIQVGARLEERYFLTILRSIAWSAFFTWWSAA